MNKADIEKWQEYTDEIKKILRYLGNEYIKTFELSAFRVHRVYADGLHVSLIDNWSGGPDYVEFSIEPENLICPNGLINRWRIEKKSGKTVDIW